MSFIKKKGANMRNKITTDIRQNQMLRENGSDWVWWEMQVSGDGPIVLLFADAAYASGS